MGKTVPSYRMALESEILEWKSFLNSLSCREDREAFEQLMDAARSYAMAGGNATRPVVFEAMAMSILLFQQKKISMLEKKLNSLRKENTTASPW